MAAPLAAQALLLVAEDAMGCCPPVHPPAAPQRTPCQWRQPLCTALMHMLLLLYQSHHLPTLQTPCQLRRARCTALMRMLLLLCHRRHLLAAWLQHQTGNSIAPHTSCPSCLHPQVLLL
jgi:hypothetical protein